MEFFSVYPKVTGYVWNRDYVNSIYPAGKDEKGNFVIFPHRLTSEKGINELIEYANSTTKKIIVTSSGNKVDIELPSNVEYRWGLSKYEYYRIMSKARWYLSCAYQETFGYTMQEAIHYGCIIAAPNRACCPEMLPAANIYSSIKEIDQIFDGNALVDTSWTEKWNHNYKKIYEDISRWK
jgi:glycosyltransferase involved in cell wall biosynthesis